MASGSDVSWPRSFRWSRTPIQSSWLQPAGRAAMKARRSACRSGCFSRRTKPRSGAFFPFAGRAGFAAAFLAAALRARGGTAAAFTAGGAGGAGAPRLSVAFGAGAAAEGASAGTATGGFLPGVFCIDRYFLFADGFVSFQHQHGERGARQAAPLGGG